MTIASIADLEAVGRPIRIGLIGTGVTGRGLLLQAERTPGMTCVAAADLNEERAVACAREAGRSFRVVGKESEVTDAVRRGELAITTDGGLVACCPEVDVVLDASSAIRAGGEFAVTAIEHGKHLVLMNAETDSIFGPALLALAEGNGVVYTSCDGDQPGVIKRLWDEVELWEFEPVMAGNIKGFLDRYSNPTSIIPEADKRRFDHRMCAAYTDGTKLCVEMSLVANALGLSTPSPGMTGPRAAHVQEVFELFDFAAIHAEHGKVVDYILGAEPGGGVYVVAHSEDAYQQFMMSVYKMGDGPYYLFYRPYHLCHIEAMACIAEAVAGRPLLQPRHGFRTNVYAYAKRDLRAGERLDDVGGYTCYGLIENCPEPAKHPGLPVCLADDVVLTRDVPRDHRIDLGDIEVPSERSDFRLFAQALEAGGVAG